VSGNFRRLLRNLRTAAEELERSGARLAVDVDCADCGKAFTLQFIDTSLRQTKYDPCPHCGMTQRVMIRDRKLIPPKGQP